MEMWSTRHARECIWSLPTIPKEVDYDILRRWCGLLMIHRGRGWGWQCFRRCFRRCVVGSHHTCVVLCCVVLCCVVLSCVCDVLCCVVLCCVVLCCVVVCVCNKQRQHLQEICNDTDLNIEANTTTAMITGHLQRRMSP
jgi:hypothetical protein